jgi:hypothetical protein
MKASAILAALVTMLPLIAALPTGSSIAEAGVSAEFRTFHTIQD